MTRTMQGVEDFLRLDMMAAAGGGDIGGAGVALKILWFLAAAAAAGAGRGRQRVGV